MKGAISIFFFSLVALSGFAQDVVIIGRAPDYKKKDISLYTYSDHISSTEIPVATETINDSGNFVFHFQIEKINRVLIRCDKQKANMYIEPGKNYLIYFPARDSLRFLNPDIEQTVALTFIVIDSTEMNSLVMNFNERFENFWETNYQAFVVGKAKHKLDSFELATKKQYSKNKNTYFHTFIDYTFADMEYSTFASREGIHRKYFTGKKIQYDNYEYMNFFNKIFRQYISKISITKNGVSIVSSINKSDYAECMAVLATDKNLQNDTLRELVLIKGLLEVYNNDQYSKDNIIKLLDYIAINSKVTAHKQIAGNVIRSFSKLRPGYAAPEFSLIDKAGKTVSLSDFKGKYVYLNFWATWCTPCMEEIKLIQNLKKKYGDKIVFISISVDENIDDMKKLMAKNPKYDWTFLFAGNDNKIKTDYEIKTAPSYFLINPQGNFMQTPALSPAQNIEGVFWSIKKKK